MGLKEILFGKKENPEPEYKPDEECESEESEKEEPESEIPEVESQPYFPSGVHLVGNNPSGEGHIDISKMRPCEVIPIGRGGLETHLSIIGEDGALASFFMDPKPRYRNRLHPYMFYIYPYERAISRLHCLVLAVNSIDGIRHRVVDLGSVGGTDIKSRSGEIERIGKPYPTDQEWRWMQVNLPGFFLLPDDTFEDMMSDALSENSSSERYELGRKLAAEYNRGVSRLLCDGDLIRLISKDLGDHCSVRYIDTRDNSANGCGNNSVRHYLDDEFNYSSLLAEFPVNEGVHSGDDFSRNALGLYLHKDELGDVVSSRDPYKIIGVKDSDDLDRRTLRRVYCAVLNTIGADLVSAKSKRDPNWCRVASMLQQKVTESYKLICKRHGFE
ncbi:hypothetical protein HN419_05785 [Candidatus Woesearchaeota archaeon]|nr:hypothetical protein [Candidatus Woesearchaeota archaeon]MBT3537619.1 hypothetical protein [Candidatus Woesearchaeota archaeon]MBT4698447.1 hypothetical protein [Candidatus Woesearchaeota archaeon]MBT4716644.1 hypothetical protein [Candidatus Woesearchaeota archaeon]MBT7105288.1 hypothetical protein [Candidatus Woesearchaeota archaeon]